MKALQAILKHNRLLICVVVLFALYIFSRTYNLYHRIIFNWDQEQFSQQIYQILKFHDIILLGPRANNDKGFFLAPYLTYMLAPLYALTNLHPVALVYFIVGFTIMFFTSTFLIIKKVFSQWYAVFFLLFWLIDPTLQRYDIIPWWPLFIPLGVLITVYCLWCLYKNPARLINWLLLGISLGFFSNMHFQFIFIDIFSGVFILFLIRQQGIVLKKFLIGTITSITGFMVMLLPLIVFDVVHNFFNTRLFIQFFTTNNGEAKDLVAWLPVFANVLRSYTLVPSILIALILYTLMLVGLGYLVVVTRDFKKVFYASFVTIWLIFPLAFMAYGKRPSEYYFIFLYPLLFLSFIDLAYIFRKTQLLVCIAVLLVIGNVSNILAAHAEDSAGLYYKDQAVKTIQPYVVDKRINVSFEGPPNTDTGFRYLLNLYSIKQTGNFNDSLLQIRIPPRQGDIVVGRFGVFIPSELKNLNE